MQYENQEPWEHQEMNPLRSRRRVEIECDHRRADAQEQKQVPLIQPAALR